MKNNYLYYNENDYELYKGKMQDVLSTFEENSVDSIVCDPPYELNFMGKGWDNSGVAFQPDTWKHCFDVLKEGGYLLAFGGSRTFHRIACAIEDAGFEIRDTIMWLYGSGFPKSMSLSKGIESKGKLGNTGTRNKRKIEQFCNTEEYNLKQTNNGAMSEIIETTRKKYIPNTELAEKWSGWGTCLKPAYEPVIVARKPFKGSLVDNVIKNGVGGINIDECRVAFENTPNPATNPLYRKQANYKLPEKGQQSNGAVSFTSSKNDVSELGRFPANVILTYDETDFEEVCGGMPDTKSTTTTTMPNLSDKNAESGIYSKLNAERIEHLGGFNDSGSASRYFYCAKASKKDRNEGLDLFEEKQKPEYCLQYHNVVKRNEMVTRKNIHPTVKPVELMQYLVRLVTPKGGTIMDCFMGSGSTGKAVMFENRERNANYKFIGVEMTEEYLPICHSRIDYAKNKYEYDLEKEIEEFKKEKEEQGYISLFDL